ncbi:hypothetical protein SEA_CAIB_25 [Gordonia phage CaiB]|nr:hypothetical protein SEA_CAIB_25 [Gordonia phage CaiB]WNM74918.1 hypothetical protein SEA_MOSSROSE_25 [Gordonia phage MossRose]
MSPRQHQPEGPRMTNYSADKLMADMPEGDEPPADQPATPTDDSVFAKAEPVAEPEPEVVTGEVIRNDEIATRPAWPHDTLEFKGDVLEVRAPTEQAMAAFSLASGKYVPMQVKNDIVGLFVARHLSDDSYGQVFSRLMDPDDPAYSPETIGELMRAIVGIAMEQRKADGEGNDEKPSDTAAQG